MHLADQLGWERPLDVVLDMQRIRTAYSARDDETLTSAMMAMYCDWNTMSGCITLSRR